MADLAPFSSASEHAKSRAKARLGVRRVDRHARLAAERGVTWDQVVGPLRRYLLQHEIGGSEKAGRRRKLVVWGGAVFVFGADGGLVTTWKLPADLRSYQRGL